MSGRKGGSEKEVNIVTSIAEIRETWTVDFIMGIKESKSNW
jgi:hypothetical protein